MKIQHKYPGSSQAWSIGYFNSASWLIGFPRSETNTNLTFMGAASSAFGGGRRCSPLFRFFTR